VSKLPQYKAMQDDADFMKKLFPPDGVPGPK
jgi:hypothetical protein